MTALLHEPRPRTELEKRVLTAVPLALAVITILLWGSNTLVGLLVGAFGLIGVWEFQTMLAKQQITLQPHLFFGAGGLFALGTIFGGHLGLTLTLAMAVVAWLFYYLLFANLKTMGELMPVGLGLLGMLWIPWAMNYFTLLHHLPHGTKLIFFLLFVIWASDTLAYFGGRWIGKTPLAPTISPKKTIEGSLCGIVGAVVVGLVYSAALPEMGWGKAIGVAIVIAVLGQMGDLVESKLKRLCDVKDSGTIFPGHGGMLDRVDALLTTAPIFYYLVC